MRDLVVEPGSYMVFISKAPRPGRYRPHVHKCKTRLGNEQLIAEAPILPPKR